MRRLKILPVLFLLLCSSIFGQISENSDYTPLWIKLDTAIQLTETGETGEAVYLFRKILEENSTNPEAEMWLGEIFNKENEYDISIKYFERAFEHRKQLIIIEDQYRILYNLAEVYIKTGNIDASTETLHKIIELSGEKIENINLLNSMVSVLKNRGYDKFIELYRPGKRISLEAFSLLGKYYYETKSWENAVEYLMQATGAVLTRVIDELKGTNPYFVFLINESTDESLVNVLDLVNKNSVLKEYLTTNYFYENFYYLGKSLIESGSIESGNYILEKLYLLPQSGKWGALSSPM